MRDTTLHKLFMIAARPVEAAGPTPGQVVGLWLIILTFVASAYVVMVLTCVAAVLRPPRPLAETSVLGRQIVGLTRFLLAFIGFLGGVLLTTTIAAGGGHWASSGGFANLTDQLWMIFLGFAATATYVYWLWIAIDLIRLGRVRRFSAVNWWYRHWLSRLGAPWAERAFRTASRAVVGGPWWILLPTFFCVPFISVVTAMQLVRMVVPVAGI